MRFQKFIIPFLFLIYICVCGVNAEETKVRERGEDIVLVVDNSASMLKNDPENFRRNQMKVFINLMPDWVKVGLISYSDTGYQKYHLSSISTMWEKMNLIEAVNRSGDTEKNSGDLAEMLQSAKKMLQEEGDREHAKAILLFTDANIQAELKDSEKLQDELIRDMVDAGIKLFFVVFCDQSKETYIQELAQMVDATDGMCVYFSSKYDMLDIVDPFFEALTGGDTEKIVDAVPSESGKTEMTITIPKHKLGDANIVITSAKNAEEINLKVIDSNGDEVQCDLTYNETVKGLPVYIATLKNLNAGEWKVTADIDRDNLYCVATYKNYDRKMIVVLIITTIFTLIAIIIIILVLMLRPRPMSGAISYSILHLDTGEETEKQVVDLSIFRRKALFSNLVTDPWIMDAEYRKLFFEGRKFYSIHFVNRSDKVMLYNYFNEPCKSLEIRPDTPCRVVYENIVVIVTYCNESIEESRSVNNV